MPHSPRLLRPRATGTHVEALAWASAVTANGGSVLPATLRAVSAFCKSIDSAGIRSLFYRLNLFCGTGLNACLVPLYRGPSQSGTQYGGTTDINNGPFVSGDYAEANGLSSSSLSGKYLDTGLLGTALPASVYQAMHLSAWIRSTGSGITDPFILGASNGATDRVYLQVSIRNSPGGTDSSTMGRVSFASSSTPVIGARGSFHMLGTRTSSTSNVLYKNGVSDGVSATSTTGIAGIPYSSYVFRNNNTGVVTGDQPGLTLWSYSIGAGMTGAQAAAFYAAHATLNSAIGRS